VTSWVLRLLLDSCGPNIFCDPFNSGFDSVIRLVTKAPGGRAVLAFGSKLPVDSYGVSTSYLASGLGVVFTSIAMFFLKDLWRFRYAGRTTQTTCFSVA